jgi:uncharacterized damage-inducible protein DinB
VLRGFVVYFVWGAAMDILDRYLGYEAWTLRHFVARCAELTPAQLHQRFDVGPGSVHETVEHIVGNLETWTDLMRARPVRDLGPLADSVAEYLRRLDAAMADFRACAQEMAATEQLDASYIDVLDDPPTAKTFGGTILHVLTHTSVHRWELQHMLARLGLPALREGDALSWEWMNTHYLRET